MQEIIIEGRPDLDRTGRDFGVTFAKKHPKYCYSNNANASLVHEIRRVRLRWYTVGYKGRYLVRLHSPSITIETKCQKNFFVRNSGRVYDNPTLCELPAIDAVYCKACQKQGTNFRKSDGKSVRQAARQKLGCIIGGF